MIKKFSVGLIIFLSFVSLTPVLAQEPDKRNASEIYEAIKKLNFLGSVLYIAAHPDDENTRLISHLANDVKALTAYLSVTRGGGGQNLIGPELGELLGVIRTHELTEAREIDGGEQLFTRARDFGYSKNPEETFSNWGKEEILSDVVLAIRKFQPDIIINRFNHRTPGTTHGHHTASAVLGYEAFDLAANKNAYPEHFSVASPWQPKRLFFNTSWWFYGSQENFEKADKTNLISLQTGGYFPSLGLSNGEIAALSRSRHQSQGFGSTGSRGQETEYLELLKGDLPPDPENLFAGINTGWSRIDGGKAIGNILYKVEQDFDFRNPSASIPELLKAYDLLKTRKDHWGIQKTEEIKEIITDCAGLFLEVIASTQNTSPLAPVSLRLEAINRSPVTVELLNAEYNGKDFLSSPQPLSFNNEISEETEIIFPENIPYTSPYWLKEKGNIGRYNVQNIELVGLPFQIKTFPVNFQLLIAGREITITRNIAYKYNSPVTGEEYQPFEVLPPVTGKIKEPVIIFADEKPREVQVILKAGRDNLSGTLTLQHPDGWKTGSPQTFQVAKKGEEKVITFTVTPTKTKSEGYLNLLIQVGDAYYDRELVLLDYSHIPYQHILLPSEAKVSRIEIQKRGNHIGYIAGAGDAIPEALQQIGYQVTELDLKTITAQSLSKYDAVVVGIRAYNVEQELKFKQPQLFKYVENGGNLILQYNVSRGLVTDNLAPFELQLSRDRVTDENAAVTLLRPEHPVLQYPNKITAADFENWIQERGLYFPDRWAPQFTPVLQMKDPGEEPVEGALLVAKYGKGYYVYTGLSFFRQLPAGVPGAYRLFANLVSLKEGK